MQATTKEPPLFCSSMYPSIHFHMQIHIPIHIQIPFFIHVHFHPRAYCNYSKYYIPVFFLVCLLFVSHRLLIFKPSRNLLYIYMYDVQTSIYMSYMRI